MGPVDERPARNAAAEEPADSYSGRQSQRNSHGHVAAALAGIRLRVGGPRTQVSARRRKGVADEAARDASPDGAGEPGPPTHPQLTDGPGIDRLRTRLAGVRVECHPGAVAAHIRSQRASGQWQIVLDAGQLPGGEPGADQIRIEGGAGSDLSVNGSGTQHRSDEQDDGRTTHGGSWAVWSPE